MIHIFKFRYWGSDDESENKDQKKDDAIDCNIPNKKRKLGISGIEVENGNNFEFCNKTQALSIDKNAGKKKKLDTSAIQIDSESCSFDSLSEQNEVLSVNDNINGKECLVNGKISPSIDFNKEEIDILKEVSPRKKKIKSKKEKLGNLQHCLINEIDNDLVIINDEAELIGSTEKEVLKVTDKTPIDKKSKSKGKKKNLIIKNIEENGLEAELIARSAENPQGVESFCTIGQIHQQKSIKGQHSLPPWLLNPTYISINLQERETPISELSYLDSNTKKNLTNAGINYLFPVQLSVIPWLMQSKEHSLVIRPSDICVSAPTGSGKTLAFVLPIVQSLRDRVVCAVRAIVVLPVSELAIQVYKVFETFTHGTDLKVTLLTGQKSFIAEQNALVRSNGEKIQNLVDIVVTTPGRINDHIYRTKGFCLKRLRYLVIDEADRMMEEIQQGWLKQVEDAVFRNCTFANCVCSSSKRSSLEPSSAYNFGFISEPLQKLLYSATLTHDPEQLHTLSLYKPKLFTASSPSSEQEVMRTCVIPSGLNMLQVVCKEDIKPMVICHLVKSHSFKKVLCFTETVERAHRLHLVLEKMGLLQIREISSFNKAIQRKIVLEQFSRGLVDILVCSDLVARGIDIDDVDCVISYDVPQFIKGYVHRIGRTARAGKTGTAITLLSGGEVDRFKKMLKPAGIEMPQEIAISAEDLKPLVNSYQTALSVADAKLRLVYKINIITIISLNSEFER